MDLLDDSRVQPRRGDRVGGWLAFGRTDCGIRCANRLVAQTINWQLLGNCSFALRPISGAFSQRACSTPSEDGQSLDERTKIKSAGAPWPGCRTRGMRDWNHDRA